MSFLSNLFGYVLLFIYNLTSNFGIAIVLFTILVKLLLLPLSIKQQKSMKLSQKLNEQMQVIQLKYKNNPEKQSQEMMKLYKEYNTSPFSGCLTVILQFVLLISMFMMVRQPLTYMEKIPSDVIEQYIQYLQENNIEVSAHYSQIDIIRESNMLKEHFKDDPYIEKIDINMNFFGIDLDMIPQSNLKNWKVYIIPVLYIISIVLSNHLTMKAQKDMITPNDKEKSLQEGQDEMAQMTNQMNSMMKYMMPVISVSIVIIAPLGLALYWTMSNICSICERLFLNNIGKEKVDG